MNNPCYLQSTEGHDLTTASNTCAQTKVKDHPASLGVTFDQHDGIPSHCWLSRPVLVLLQLPEFCAILDWHRSTLPGIEPGPLCTTQ